MGQQLPRQKLTGALAAAISPARHGDLCHYFFEIAAEIAAAKSRPRLFLPRQSLGPDCFCRGKVPVQLRYCIAHAYRDFAAAK